MRKRNEFQTGIFKTVTFLTSLRQNAPCGSTGMNGVRRPRRLVTPKLQRRRKPAGRPSSAVARLRRVESRVASAQFRLALPQMPRPVGGELHFW